MNLETAAGQRAFSVWLRTGRWPAADPEDVELKFNPYHDPRNSQFTFAPGGPRSLSRVVISDRRVNAGRMRNASPVPYLSSVHNEIISLASKYPPVPGTKEWTSVDAARLLIGDKDVHEFKRQWIQGYRKAIVAAANRYDLPPELVAGVAYNEVGGDPLVIDSLAYSARSDAARDRTSFGNVSIQVRRAAEALGYGTSQDLTPSQRRMMIASLKQPQTSIFIAAKHLSDLRNIDYRGIPASRLSKTQVEIIATRYNSGPDLPISQIRRDLRYGTDLTKRWKLLGTLVRQ